jgi:hypothetical protein
MIAGSGTFHLFSTAKLAACASRAAPHLRSTPGPHHHGVILSLLECCPRAQRQARFDPVLPTITCRSLRHAVVDYILRLACPGVPSRPPRLSEVRPLCAQPAATARMTLKRIADRIRIAGLHSPLSRKVAFRLATDWTSHFVSLARKMMTRCMCAHQACGPHLNPELCDQVQNPLWKPPLVLQSDGTVDCFGHSR